MKLKSQTKANQCTNQYVGCFYECACGDCNCGCGGCYGCYGCGVYYRKKRYADSNMYWTYSTGNVGMNVEMCILGCAANGFSYAGLQYG